MAVTLHAIEPVRIKDVEYLSQGIVITFSDHRVFVFKHNALVALRENHAREIVDALEQSLNP